jgi:hypothetical protein
MAAHTRQCPRAIARSDRAGGADVHFGLPREPIALEDVTNRGPRPEPGTHADSEVSAIERGRCPGENLMRPDGNTQG